MNDKTWFLERTAKYLYQGKRPLDPLNEAENIFSIFATIFTLPVNFLASLLNVSRNLRRIALRKITFKYMCNGLMRRSDPYWEIALLEKNWTVISHGSASFVLNPFSSGQRSMNIIDVVDLWFAHTRHPLVEFGAIKRLRNMARALMRVPPANNTRYIIHKIFKELQEYTRTTYKKNPSPYKKKEHSKWKTSLLKLPDVNAEWKVLISNRTTIEIINILETDTPWTLKRPPTKRSSELESISCKRLKTDDIMIE